MPERYTAAMSPAVAKRLLTTADYHAMIAAGILGEDDRVELRISQSPAVTVVE